MRDYLSNRYSMFDQKGAKVFIPSHVQEELLCAANVASLHIKQTLQKNYSKMTFDQFVKVVEVALDLE